MFYEKASRSSSPLRRDCRPQWRWENHLCTSVFAEGCSHCSFRQCRPHCQRPFAVKAGIGHTRGWRLFLAELDRLAKARVDFAFETTLSGLVYRERLKHWKKAGYRIEIIFLRLPSPSLAFRRIAARVKQGGHDVPRVDVVRRFTRGWKSFQNIYKPLADAWRVYDNSGDSHRLLETNP